MPAISYLSAPGIVQAGSVLRVIGLVLLIFSATMLVPLAVALAMAEPSARAFAQGCAVTAASGGAVWMLLRRHDRELAPRDGFLLVSLVWLLLPAFAALPLLHFLPSMSFTDGYFEAVSGLTTTGATVLEGLDRLPVSINLWRAQLQWLGGMGLIVLAVAILPLLGVGGRQLFQAEVPGAFKDARLTPRIGDTARGLWIVYVGISLACGLCYWAAGMTAADAVIHAFSTMSLGGFSSHDASFGHFNSPVLEGVAIVFMLVAGVNFSTHFLAWRARSPSPYRGDAEATWFLGITVGTGLLIAGWLAASDGYPSFWTALRHALFNVVSVATTTGYASTDYNTWPVFLPGLMLLLCLFASSAGSTGGGVKMIRVRIALLQVRRELVRLCHPSAVVPLRVGRHVVPPQTAMAVLNFLALYAALIVLFTMLLTASGLALDTAASAVVACISNTGPGLNEVGPAGNYGVLTDFQTWVCAVAMLVGRLEVFTVLVLFTRGYWRR